MRGRLVAGLILVLIGAGLLLDAMHRLDFGQAVGKWWPLLLILVGLVHLFTSHGRPLGGLILLLVGGFFLAKNLGALPANWGAYVAPVVLILIGIVVLVAPRRRMRRREPHRYWGPTDTSENAIHRSAFLGGFEERVHSRPFRGGTVEAFMGGAKVDLRDAELPPEGAELTATATLGGIEILVPTAWRVEVSGSPFLGGIDNRTTNAAGPVLRIKANAFLGGIDIKN